MTFLGVIFSAAGLICFLWRRSSLLPLLIIASVFEAGAIFNSELGDFNFGVPPFYLIEIFIFLHLVMVAFGQRKLLPSKNVRVRGIVVLLCVFWFWCFLSAFVMPRVFAGTLVLSNRNETHEFVPLQWTLSNLAQAGYLTLNVATVIYAVQVVRTRGQAERLMKAFYWAAFIVVAIGFAEFIADRAGWDFPYELFNNNSGYAQGFEQEIDSIHRVNSTFMEPSMAGSYLAAVSCGLLAGFWSGGRKTSQLLALLGVLSALVLTTSGTGFATMAIGVCLFIVHIWRSRKLKRRRKLSVSKWIFILSALGIAAYTFFSSPDLVDAVWTATIDKINSFSFWGRLAKEVQALIVFANTYGAGAGLGSNRASGLLTTMLSSVGVVGTFLFGVVFYRVAKLFPGISAPKSLQVGYWALLMMLVSEVVAVPDINRPVLWGLFVIVVAQLNVHFDPRPGLEPVKRRVVAVRPPLLGPSGVAPAR